MRRTRLGRAALGFLVATGMAAAASQRAEAAFTFTLLEEGGDVVATGTGTLNVAAFIDSVDISPNTTNVLQPSSGAIARIGPDYTIYFGPVWPVSFGPGLFTAASTASGASVGISAVDGLLVVPLGYVSNGPLAAAMTFSGVTFASLGVTPGSYIFNWGEGETADSFTVQIGPAAVPEPASALLLGAGLLGLASVRRRPAA
jgi:hypothetical protein